MKKPDFVSCHDCQHFYWYAGKCSAHTEPESGEFEECEDGFWWSTMCPETITWCNLFELKHTQEHGFEYYDHLPSLETIKKMKDVYIKLCSDLIIVVSKK